MDRWSYLLLLQKRRQCESSLEWVSQESTCFLGAGGSDVAPSQRKQAHPCKISSFYLKVWVTFSAPATPVQAKLPTQNFLWFIHHYREDVGKASRNGCKGERVSDSATKFLCNLVQIISHICASISNLWYGNSSTSSHPCIVVLNYKIFQGKNAYSQVNIQSLALQGTFSPTCFLMSCLGFAMTDTWGKPWHLCVTCICVQPRNVISFPEVCAVIRQIKCPSPLVIIH